VVPRQRADGAGEPIPEVRYIRTTRRHARHEVDVVRHQRARHGQRKIPPQAPPKPRTEMLVRERIEPKPSVTDEVNVQALFDAVGNRS